MYLNALYSVNEELNKLVVKFANTSRIFVVFSSSRYMCGYYEPY